MNFDFRIQPISTGSARKFQLRIGLSQDNVADFIPVYQSAFAQCVPLEAAHHRESDAHLELSVLLEWLRSREVTER